MKYEVVSLFDSVTGLYGRPFYLSSIDQAKRVAIDVLSGNTDVSRHPADFRLVHLGDFDDQSGLINCFPDFVVLVRMDSVVLPDGFLDRVRKDDFDYAANLKSVVDSVSSIRQMLGQLSHLRDLKTSSLSVSSRKSVRNSTKRK